MTAPKPIALTQRDSVAGEPAPEPLVIVGGLPVATAARAGGVKQAVALEDSEATDAAGIVADFNTLLANLRTAGVIA